MRSGPNPNPNPHPTPTPTPNPTPNPNPNPNPNQAAQLLILFVYSPLDTIYSYASDKNVANLVFLDDFVKVLTPNP